MTLREYIAFWQETYDKHQSRPTTYAAHNYVFKNHMPNEATQDELQQAANILDNLLKF